MSDSPHPTTIGMSFRARATPLPAEMRSAWRIPMLLLALDKCHGRSATFEQLHVLNWAVKSPQSRATFLRVLNGRGRTDDVIVRYDPTLNRAIDLAIGLKLVEWLPTGRVRLTTPGINAVRLLSRVDSLQREREFFAQIPGKLSQTQIDRMIRLL